MFNALRRSKLGLNKNDLKKINVLIKKDNQKHPIKVSEFSSLRKNDNNGNINNNISSGKNEEIKINYSIEDTKSFDGLLISLTSIGNIFIYDIYSKKLKKISCFSTNHLKAKGIHINSLRNSLIITSFVHTSDINNIQCFEIFFSEIKSNSIFNINNFIQILKTEEFLDSECFVQFDEYNKVIVSRNILRTNKIWNFQNYKKNFEFTNTNLNEIRITGGSLLICEKVGDNIRQYILQILDINNGKLLFKTEIAFKPNKKIVLFEFIKNYIFVKQDGNYPLYINLITNQIKIIKEEIDNEALFIYTGNSNKFILISLDRYLIFNIEGTLLKKIINNNITTEIKQNDICSPIYNSIENIPFIICWHLVNVSFSDSNSKSSLRPSSGHISSNRNFDDEINSKNFSPFSNKDYTMDYNYIDRNFNLHSPLSEDNPNNLGFIENGSNLRDNYSMEGLYGEHQIDIVFLDDIHHIRNIKFKINFNQSIISINYIQESNSVFIITNFGEIFEIIL